MDFTSSLVTKQLVDGTFGENVKDGAGKQFTDQVVNMLKEKHLYDPRDLAGITALCSIVQTVRSQMLHEGSQFEYISISDDLEFSDQLTEAEVERYFECYDQLEYQLNRTVESIYGDGPITLQRCLNMLTAYHILYFEETEPQPEGTRQSEQEAAKIKKSWQEAQAYLREHIDPQNVLDTDELIALIYSIEFLTAYGLGATYDDFDEYHCDWYDIEADPIDIDLLDDLLENISGSGFEKLYQLQENFED